jgi:hypothetical protein
VNANASTSANTHTGTTVVGRNGFVIYHLVVVVVTACCYCLLLLLVVTAIAFREINDEL